MENTPVTGIISNLKNLKVRSLVDNSYLDAEHDGLYFETFDKKRIDMLTVNEKKVQDKPFYPKQYLGYFYINLYNFNMEKLDEIFSKAKIAGVDFGLYRYNKKFYNDTDIWFSQLHPFVFLAFYKTLQWTAMASWIAEEKIEWTEKMKKIIVADDVVVLCNFNRVILADAGETVDLGLKIEKKDELFFNFTNKYLVIDASDEYSDKFDILLDNLNLTHGKIVNNRVYLQQNVEFNSVQKQIIIDFIDNVLPIQNVTFTLQYFLDAILF